MFESIRSGRGRKQRKRSLFAGDRIIIENPKESEYKLSEFRSKLRKMTI